MNHCMQYTKQSKIRIIVKFYNFKKKIAGNLDFQPLPHQIKYLKIQTKDQYLCANTEYF